MDLRLNNRSSAMNKQTLSERVAYYKDQLAKSPSDSKLYLQLADLLAETNQSQEAVNYYRTAVNLIENNNEDDRYSPQIRAILIKIYEKILALSPLDYEICKSLATEYNFIDQNTKAYDLYLSTAEKLYEQGDYKKALSLYESALILFPDSATLHIRCADIYYQLGQLEKSADEYMRLGELNLNQSNPQGALDCFKNALQLVPSGFPARVKLAMAYRELGEMEMALATYLGLANDYLEKGEAPAALEHYENCLAINPDLSEAIEGKKRVQKLIDSGLEIEELEEVKEGNVEPDESFSFELIDLEAEELEGGQAPGGLGSQEKAQTSEEKSLSAAERSDASKQLSEQVIKPQASQEQLQEQVTILKHELDMVRRERDETRLKYEELNKKHIQLRKILRYNEQERRKLVQRLSEIRDQKPEVRNSSDF